LEQRVIDAPVTRKVRAPAKLNLIHRVGPLRDDGFHDVVGVVQLVDLFDWIDIAVLPSESRVVRVDAPGVPGGDTLATRAANAFLDATGIVAAVDIRIDKQIPVGGGLGGGSSDAASVLSTLNELCATQVSGDHLRQLGAEIGSDVPIFLSGAATCTVSGRGEFVDACDVPARQWNIVSPGFEVSTAEVYARARVTNSLPALSSVLRSARSGEFTNDLADAVIDVAPEVGQLIEELRASTGREPLVCGAGSCVAVEVEGPTTLENRVVGGAGR
jgi:4-diphosphocytidyl-2-C-methyl-D-erythritol kinase